MQVCMDALGKSKVTATMTGIRKGTAMRQRKSCLVVVVWGLTLCSTTYALAGDVKLLSGKWDKVCRVEISWGRNAPESTPVESHTDVPKNWSVTKPDKLCYRRALDPGNCESGMTQWNTPWKCAASAGPGVEEFSLQ